VVVIFKVRVLSPLVLDGVLLGIKDAVAPAGSADRMKSMARIVGTTEDAIHLVRPPVPDRLKPRFYFALPPGIE